MNHRAHVQHPAIAAGLIANLAFYLAFVLHDGPVICVDTPSYINMAYSREPVYPTFLWLLRQVFGYAESPYGEETYLVAAVVIQAVIMAVCVWYTARVVAGILPGMGRSLSSRWRVAIRRDGAAGDTSAATGPVSAGHAVSDTAARDGGAADMRPANQHAVGDAPVYLSEPVSYFLANLAFWGVDLLNRFAAARGSMYVECIMTESLCIPLFYVFIARAYLYFAGGRRARGDAADQAASGNDQFHPDEDKAGSGVNPTNHGAAARQWLRWDAADRQYGDLAVLFLLMLLMMSIRKQEMITCVILCGFAFLYELLLRRKWQRFLACVAISVAALGLMTLLDYSYNYISRGVWMHHTHNYKGAACTFLYTSSRDDADLFENEEDRAIFLEIYEEMEAQGLTYDSVDESDWIARTDHYAEAYDHIGYDILIPVITEHVEAAHPELDRPHQQIAIDEQQRVIQNALIRQDKGRLVELWIGNFIEGFVNTVLRKTRTLAHAAAVLYALYDGLLLYLAIWQNKAVRKARSAPERECGPVLLFACLVMFAVTVNVVVVGSMIFTQTRYMIYNMAFFYIALGVMIAALRYNRRQHH